MIKAVDTSVLIAIAKPESNAHSWIELLAEAQAEGDLVIFLIGAHAQVQADRLAAMDCGYLRRYFPRLRLLKP